MKLKKIEKTNLKFKLYQKYFLNKFTIDLFIKCCSFPIRLSNFDQRKNLIQKNIS